MAPLLKALADLSRDDVSRRDAEAVAILTSLRDPRLPWAWPSIQSDGSGPTRVEMPVLTERKQRRARNFGSLGCILKSQVMVEEQTRSEISPETQRRSLTALVVFLPICPRTSLSASCENIRRMNQHRLLHLHGMMMHRIFPLQLPVRRSTLLPCHTATATSLIQLNVLDSTP